MKKVIFILSFLWFMPHIAYSEASNPKIDSLINISNELKQQNRELSMKVDNLEKLYDKRFSDLFWFLGVFVSIFLALLVLNYINANNVARKQASEELEKMKEATNLLENKTIEIDKNINLYKQELETISTFRNNAGLNI